MEAFIVGNVTNRKDSDECVEDHVIPLSKK